MYTYAQAIPVSVAKVEISDKKFEEVSRLIKEHVEQVLVGYDYITLVNRDINNLTERERRLQRKESFMDGKYVKQDQAVGAQWIIKMQYDDKRKDLDLQIADVETDKVMIFENYKIGRFLTKDRQIERPRYFGRYLKEKLELLFIELDVAVIADIVIFDIAESKDDKAIKVALYCEKGCDLTRNKELEVYLKKNTDSKKYSTKIKIGKVKIKHVESNEVYVAEVKDGHKEILTSFNTKENLICIDENN